MNIIKSGFLMAQMKINQWKTQSELEDMQNEKLCQLSEYCSKNVPQYKDVRIRSVEDLENLPIVKKNDIRDMPGSFISKQFKKENLAVTETSGSTGIPLKIYEDEYGDNYRMALYYHPLTECGLKPTDLQAEITHIPRKPVLLQKLGIFRRNYLCSQDDEKKLLMEIKDMKADVLYAYPSIARFLAECNITEEIDYKIKKIFAYGETLTKETRDVIKRSFKSSVFDFYGCAETHWTVWECPEGSLHIHSDSCIFEILNDKGEPVKGEEEGQVIVTPLWKRAMPLLRYAVGDRAVFGSKCRCGRGLHVLKSIYGRDDDQVILPSGKIRSARSINPIDFINEVLAYQIVQERRDLLVFKYVPSRIGPTKALLKSICQKIKKGCLNEKVTVECEEVDKLLGSRSGKIRVFISKVEKHENA